MEVSTVDLPSTPLFAPSTATRAEAEEIHISHQRAKVIALRYSLTIHDILGPSTRFFSMFSDMISSMDIAATGMNSIQTNLAAGTLAPFVLQRPELWALLDDILSFRISAQFVMTELGHGLDAPNLETTATLQANGSFDLHTPHPGAAKFMPPTLPYSGVPAVGIVVARLIVRGEDYGVRPFVVPFNDGVQLCKGITAKALPSRGGSRSMGHTITYFDHVVLPPSSLLGDLRKVQDHRQHFLHTIWRVGVGSLSLSALVIPCLKVSAYTLGKYSQQRYITGPSGRPIPIISFRTQHMPILNALAQAFVLDAFYKQVCEWFTETPREKIELRNAFSTIAKATLFGHWYRTMSTFSERCGARGLFDVNQLLRFVNELRGVSVAEGDTLVLSIRLASELILRRYDIPEATQQDSLLIRHERGIMEEMTTTLLQGGRDHRGSSTNQMNLPRSLPLVEAIGHRMAWEAAKAASVPAPLTDLAWYIERGLVSRKHFARMQSEAFNDVLERLDEYLEATGAAPYAVAPILSESSWDAYVQGLPSFSGNASYDAIPPQARL
ncbi:acyl-CoA oxidase [Panus rudis PR-1116 ss-1]|nr:acyl-CoA oxidase [Panus rudis PR-1116 ss-1]